MNSPVPIDINGIEIHLGDLIRRPLLGTKKARAVTWTVKRIRIDRCHGNEEWALTIESKGVAADVAAHKIEVALEAPQRFIKALPI